MLNNGFSLIVVNGTAILSWFEEAPKDSAMHKLYEKMLEDPSLLADDINSSRHKLRVRSPCLVFVSVHYQHPLTYYIS